MTTMFATLALLASPITAFAQGHPQQVASYGAWALVEGPTTDGGFWCGIGIRGTVHGIPRSFTVGRERGTKATITITVWYGNTLMDRPVPDHVILAFNDGGYFTMAGSRVWSRSDFFMEDPAQFIERLTTSPATELTIKTDEAPALTAKLDGAADATAAMQACLSGATLSQPQPYQPLR
jgi:hypothetical protein